MNTLMTIAVAGAIALGDYMEAAAVVVLFSAAKWLEDGCSACARDAISSVLALKPETAVLAGTGASRTCRPDRCRAVGWHVH
jgi:Cd2+/Zn2+-exporting ATPase